MTSGELYRLRDPLSQSPQAELVHQFDSINGLTGITETEKDTFIVAGGTFLPPVGMGISDPESWGLWQVKLRGSGKAPTITKVIDTPDIPFINGMVTNPYNKAEVLFNDFVNGVVYKINLKTKIYKAIIDVPEMKAPPGSPLRPLNGLKIHNDFLYWSNSASGILARLKIDKTGLPTKTAQVEILSQTGYILDDFAIDSTGTPWITAKVNNTILSVTPGGETIVVAGSPGEFTVASAAACAFGRTAKDQHILYLVTSGGLSIPINGTLTEGGKIIALDTLSYNRDI
ncbi:putative hetero-Diels-Alderase [Paramyrothecium foliicola]|nr:putative hetero-Diels-Alderase [Paramyrothecium foliicola]